MKLGNLIRLDEVGDVVNVVEMASISVYEYEKFVAY